jgi:hypothetical protein
VPFISIGVAMITVYAMVFNVVVPAVIGELYLKVSEAK